MILCLPNIDLPDSPPKCPDTERKLLAAVLDGGQTEQAKFYSEIKPKDFQVYEEVAEAICEIHEDDGRADPATVEAKIHPGSVQAIMEDPPSKQSIETLAKDVRETATNRRIGARSLKIAERALQNEEDSDVVLEEAESMVVDTSRQRHRGEFVRVGEVVDEVLDEKMKEQGSSVIGVPCGIEGIDHQTRGWHDGRLVVIAGRAHMGKTNFLLNSLLHAAKNGHNAAVVTLEETTKHLASRLMHIESQVPVDAGGSRNYRSEGEERKLKRATQTLKEVPLHIEDTPNLSPREVQARLLRLKVEEDIDIVAVDYLQKMKPPEGASEEDWIGRACHMLQGQAQSLDIPVLLVSQMNRYADHRSDKRPQMSDLRESGGIEEAADVVGFLYRPAYYGETRDEAGRSTEGVAEFIVKKDRARGSAFTEEIYFDEDCGFFGDLDQRGSQDPPTPGPNGRTRLDPDDPKF